MSHCQKASKVAIISGWMICHADWRNFTVNLSSPGILLGGKALITTQTLTSVKQSHKGDSCKLGMPRRLRLTKFETGVQNIVKEGKKLLQLCDLPLSEPAYIIYIYILQINDIHHVGWWLSNQKWLTKISSICNFDQPFWIANIFWSEMLTKITNGWQFNQSLSGWSSPWLTNSSILYI
jgi:hypothetical protein